jgi:hypothetical protein
VVGPEFTGFLACVNQVLQVESERIGTVSVRKPLGFDRLLAVLSVVIRILFGHFGFGVFCGAKRISSASKKNFLNRSDAP